MHPIEELLTHAPEKLIKIYTTKGKKSAILDKAQKKNIPVHFVSKDQLTEWSKSESHQLFLAHIRSRNFLKLDQFIDQAEEPSLILILDRIFDPQNLGAIIRSAECFGASAVLWSKNRGSDLSPVAAKTSSGASELLPLVRVSNLAHSLKELKEGGFEIVAAQVVKGAEPAYQFHFAPKTALILGSEGEGIQPLLQKLADRSIYLPMKGKISSLNVAQATTSFLVLWQNQSL